MRLFIGAGIGVLAGLIGAAIWAAISYYGNVEIGWIAWAIGAAVGFAVAVGTSGEGGATPATIAVVIAAASVLGGKYAATAMHVDEVIDAQHIVVTDEVAITYVCDSLLEEAFEEGEPMTWPDGRDVEGGYTQSDYPADLWTEAETLYASWSPDEQAAYREDIQAMVDDAESIVASIAREEGFMSSFSAFDLLWGFLALGTAFKIAFAGTSK
ncbi:MAG: hypothetical protein AAGI30_13025 [Planctomycetota bacterium]